MQLVTQMVAFIVLLAVVSGKSFAAQDPGAQRLLGISQSLQSLQQEIPAYYLSPEALAESHDYDPGKIVSWVKQNIQFQPSPGYLLEPQGALQTATGNSLEQAVLLQNVLVQAGLEVRLAKATLDTEQARALLLESFVASPARQWQLDPAIREERFKQISRELDGSETAVSDRYAALESLTPWTQSPVYQDAKRLAGNFSRSLSDAKAWQVGVDPLEPWIANAQTYYFVKYRFSQGEPWVDAHPAFAMSSPKIEKSSYLTQGIEDQHHQVTVRAFITREIDGKQETIPVSGLHRSTAAAIFEQQLQFTTIASGLQQAIEEKSLEILKASRFFAPSINGKLASSARFFTLDGSDFSPAEVADPMGKLGNVANEKVGQVTSQLGGALGSATPKDGDTSTPTSRLLHYYLEIEWAAPNGHKRSLKRTIYRHQPGEDLQITAEIITQSATLSAIPATLAPAAELFYALESQRDVLELLAKLKSQQYSTSQITQQLAQWSRERNDLVFNLAVKLSENAAESARLFSHAPVIALRWEKQGSDAAQITFDYLVNSAQVALIDGNTVSIDQSRTLDYGVWSTYAEAILHGSEHQRDALGDDAISAAGEFNKSLAQTGLLIVGAEDLDSSGSPGAASIPAVLVERIRANPEYVYLLPKPTPDSMTTAYYRVHRLTGEALGYSIDGRGSTITETTKLLLIDIATAVAVGKLVACFVGGGSERAVVTCAGCTLLQYAVAGIAFGLTPVAAAVSGGVATVGCAFL